MTPPEQSGIHKDLEYLAAPPSPSYPHQPPPLLWLGKRKRGRRSRRIRHLGGPRRTRMGSSAFDVTRSFTSPLSAPRRIATVGNALVLTIGPKTASGQALARRVDGVASVYKQEATMKSTAPFTNYAALVERGAPLVSSRPTTARTPHRRRRATIPVPTFMISSTLKHSRESGRWEGLMS